MGINNSQMQTTNDDSGNLHNWLRDKDGISHEKPHNHEVFGHNNLQINEEDLEESIEALNKENSIDITQNITNNSKRDISKYLSNKSYNNRKKNVNYQNEAIIQDLENMFEESSRRTDVNDRYSSPKNKSFSNKDGGKELLTITVEIGNGQKENIVIYENDDAQEISDAFWERHSISDELKVIFGNQIAENIIQVKNEIAKEHQRLAEPDRNESEKYSNISPPSIEQPLFSDV